MPHDDNVIVVDFFQSATEIFRLGRARCCYACQQKR